MIHKLYILPSFQGKGIGKVFLDYLTVLARQTAHDTLMLKIFVKNQNAIRFYQHLGFHSIGEEVSELGKGYIRNDQENREGLDIIFEAVERRFNNSAVKVSIWAFPESVAS